MNPLEEQYPEIVPDPNAVKHNGNRAATLMPSLTLAPGTDNLSQPKAKGLALAAGLIDTSGTGGDVTVDELVSLPVQKPSKSQFFRIHPDLHADINLLKVESNNGSESYAVYPHMVKHVDGVQLYTLFLGVHRDGSCFLWPVSATSSDGWSRTARQIAVAGIEKWVRLVANRTTNMYIMRVAKECQDDPQFPKDKTFDELLYLAFGDGHIISDSEHPIVKDLWL